MRVTQLALTSFSKALWPSTAESLKKVGLRRGDRCLDLGCGRGDVSMQLASFLGPVGTVKGVDSDPQTVADAQAKVEQMDFSKQIKIVHAEFPKDASKIGNDFDFVFCRLLFSLLPQPSESLRACKNLLVPGGHIYVEDVDHSSSFIWPESPAFRQAQELYSDFQGSGHPFIGPQLFKMVQEAGFEDVTVQVKQPVFTRNQPGCEVQRELLESIQDDLVAAGLETKENIQKILAAMRHAEAEEGVTIGLPRVFQVHGTKPMA